MFFRSAPAGGLSATTVDQWDTTARTQYTTVGHDVKGGIAFVFNTLRGILVAGLSLPFRPTPLYALTDPFQIIENKRTYTGWRSTVFGCFLMLFFPVLSLLLSYIYILSTYQLREGGSLWHRESRRRIRLIPLGLGSIWRGGT